MMLGEGEENIIQHIDLTHLCSISHVIIYRERTYSAQVHWNY